ncbi:SIS domain-containing protein [Coniochaeta ligniaria NRRL 30616]|uniref:SIS domain-containing protein n=1 Tax=Coniochaeta ligniaria NRRL 30616 TaxID=1408157 RepID=A0A1J7J2W2_9PEZI|nr:SIS domain-containing protein [Coniochaeta ligniaria NRRL 30616]
MVDSRPVQTSAVYLLGPGAAPQFPAIPPPSPPSPVTPEESNPCTPIEELDLNACAEDYGQSDVEYDFHSSNTSFSNDLRDTAPLDDRLAAAVHVLSTEAVALSSLTQLYATDSLAREAFSRAVEVITRQPPPYHPRGKLILIGVGKSGHIARKLTATFNSLSVPATFLHPTEALHGDLGVINSRTDTALLITYSGKTPEITGVLPHLDPALPLVLLTGAAQHGKHCDVVRLRPDAIVLPSPVHELETVSFGLAAPTTSTTAALAVGDALALVCAGELHGGPPTTAQGPSQMPSFGMNRVASVFARNHPGGAIGAATNTTPSPSPSTPKRPGDVTTVRHLAAPWREIPVAVGEAQVTAPPGCLLHIGGGGAPVPSPLTAADVLRAGYASPSGWVRVCGGGGGGRGGGVVSPAQIRSLRSRDLGRRVDELPGLVVRRSDFVSVAADTSASRAADWVRELMMSGSGGETAGCRPDSIVCLLDKGECVGVLEVKELLEHCGS